MRQGKDFCSAHVRQVQSHSQGLLRFARGTKSDGETLGFYLRSLGDVSSAGPRGESFLLGLKSPSSGSTSSSKRVSRGEGLGFTATSGRFLGFLELENHRENSRLGRLRTTQVLDGPELMSRGNFARI